MAEFIYDQTKAIDGKQPLILLEEGCEYNNLTKGNTLTFSVLPETIVRATKIGDGIYTQTDGKTAECEIFTIDFEYEPLENDEITIYNGENMPFPDRLGALLQNVDAFFKSKIPVQALRITGSHAPTH